MTPPPILPPSPPAPARRRGWIALGVFTFGLLALPGALVVAALGCLRLGSDPSALRDAALAAEPHGWSRQVECSLGWLPLAVGRAAAGFVDVPPEVRTVLGAVRSVDVAVYQPAHSSATAKADHATLFAQADRAMDRRGWARTVGVLQDDQLVAVYAPAKARPDDEVHLCVLVLNDDQLVVASARGRVGPLLALLPQHSAGVRLAAARLP